MAVKTISILFLLFSCFAAAQSTVTIGSKNFTESYILGEILAQTIEDAGELKVDRKFGLGGTGIVIEALKAGEIHIYSEYTGTIKQVILKKPIVSDEEARNLLSLQGIVMTPSLGFNNTYAIGVRGELAEERNLQTISDLTSQRDLKSGFSYEFTKREDGLVALEKAYGFSFPNPLGMEHSLAYQALENNKIDIIELYSTDAKIKANNIKVLKDDKGFFPSYLAVLLFRKDTFIDAPKTKLALAQLEGRINEQTMIELNAMVDIDGKSFQEAAFSFLGKSNARVVERDELSTLTGQHFRLVFISLFFAIILAIPLAILAYKFQSLSQPLLVGVGILQTIPSLALLCFMIPVFGIGTQAALIALFIYALLPIVRSTYTGLVSISPRLIESADSIGLGSWKKLIYVEIPLSSINILSGIKTSAVINVGTATLAAFIGAGGYGQLIVTGLALNDTQLILKGAIPAALMAVVFHGLFELVERVFLPKTLKN